MIVSGLPECDSFDDGTLFNLLVETMNIDSKIEPKHIKRLGDSKQNQQRYIKAFLKSNEEKDMIMKKAKNLKNARKDGLPFDPQRVYIGHDLTKIQREKEYKMRKKRRQAAARSDTHGASGKK